MLMKWLGGGCRWAQMLPACIQVCPVELPGRGRRRDEAGISDVAALADVLVESLPLQVHNMFRLRYTRFTLAVRELCHAHIAGDTCPCQHIEQCMFTLFHSL